MYVFFSKDGLFEEGKTPKMRTFKIGIITISPKFATD